MCARVLGVCIGGDRGSGYVESKNQLLRSLDDQNEEPKLRKLEKDIVANSEPSRHWPMGFWWENNFIGL